MKTETTERVLQVGDYARKLSIYGTTSASRVTEIKDGRVKMWAPWFWDGMGAELDEPLSAFFYGKGGWLY